MTLVRFAVLLAVIACAALLPFVSIVGAETIYPMQSVGVASAKPAPQPDAGVSIDIRWPAELKGLVDTLHAFVYAMVFLALALVVAVLVLLVQATIQRRQ